MNFKTILATAGFGAAAYVLYEALSQNKGISTDNEGGFIDVAAGILQGGFMKVANIGNGMGMSVSITGLAHIKGWEGFKPNVYIDAAGYKTIGFGHKLLTTENYKTVTNEEATRLLIKDLTVAESAVNDLVTIKLSQFQFDALVSFVFNVGRGAFARSTLLKKVNAGLFADAELEFLKWVNAGGVRVQGLINRRVADSKLFAAGSVA